jgi:hypothetical protein
MIPSFVVRSSLAEDGVSGVCFGGPRDGGVSTQDRGNAFDRAVVFPTFRTSFRCFCVHFSVVGRSRESRFSFVSFLDVLGRGRRVRQAITR